MNRPVLLSAIFGLLASCSSSHPKASTQGGQGGSKDDTGGSGGRAPSSYGGAGGTSTGGARGAATGGSGGSAAGGAGGEGETGDASSGGAAGADAASTGGAEGASDAAIADGGSSAGLPAWYEAEESKISGRAVRGKCAPCASHDMMKPGDTCCSGGGQVNWIVSAGNGEVLFEAVKVPADDMYDVTWWYFCGKKDNFGDTNCGGQTDPPTTSAGCRPHQFYVNGALLPGAYHFPCFDGPWSIVRAATTRLPLKAGTNTIRMHAPPPRDCVDLDAIEVLPSGKGVPPLIGSRPDLTGH